MAAFPALALNQPTFDPAGMLQAATGIEGARTRNQLALAQLAEQQERQSALRNFAQRGGIGSPNALGVLSRFPDLYSQALAGSSARQQAFALTNARAAQRVLGIAPGPARDAAYREEMDRALSEGRIDEATHRDFLTRPPTDLHLQGIISMAAPIESEQQRMQTELLRAQTERLRRGQELVDELLGRTPRRPGAALPAVGALSGPAGGDAAMLQNQVTEPGLNALLTERWRGASDPRSAADLYADVFSGLPPRRATTAPPTPDFPLTRNRLLPPELSTLPNAQPPADMQPPVPPLVPPQPASPAQSMLPVDPSMVSNLALQQANPPAAPDAMVGAGRDFATSLTSQPADAASAATPNAQSGTGIGGALRQAFSRLTREDQIAMMLALIKDDYATVANIVRGVTPGTEAVDRKYAEDYASWTAGGGAADVQRQLAQLKGVERALADPNSNITGNWADQWRLGDVLNPIFGQHVISNRQKVEEVVQRSLRQILGAQFTEQEAVRLIERAYDTRLPQSENRRRVQALLTQIGLAAQAKQSAADYFGRYGTLRGWEGRVPTMADFSMLFDAPGGGSEAPPVEGARRGNDGKWYVPDPGRPGKYLRVDA